MHTRAPIDSASTAHADPLNGQSAAAVHFGMHTGSPPLSRTHAPEPGHSDDVADGVVHRAEQKRTVCPVAEVFERHRRVSPAQGSSREHAEYGGSLAQAASEAIATVNARREVRAKRMARGASHRSDRAVKQCRPERARRDRVRGPGTHPHEERLMTHRPKRLAILCAGGPAPGLNSVIAAATIRAHLAGVDVLGIHDGYQWIMQGDIKHVSQLTLESVSRIHFRGGSHIGISRANPTKSDKLLDATLLSLLRLNVDKLVSIGGDGSAWTAWRLSERSRGQLRVAHVPKTIDNDIDLPPDIDTFGYQTARHIGVEIVKNLMVDAKTTHRWCLVVTQGRKAGHLALGIGKAAGATVTLIPEEFGDGPVRLDTIVDTLVGAVIKRLGYDRRDGLAVLAEGLVERLPVEELEQLPGVDRDQHGGLRYSDINFADVLKARVVERLRALGIQTSVVARNVGYELRCADPIPYDMEYTRDLGYGAARYLLEGGESAMISMQAGSFKPVPFEAIVDPASGRSRVRMVDIRSDRYRIARSYMIRLRREDFDDHHQCTRLAAIAGLDAEAFRARFDYLVRDDERATREVSLPPPPPRP